MAKDSHTKYTVLENKFAYVEEGVLKARSHHVVVELVKNDLRKEGEYVLGNTTMETILEMATPTQRQQITLQFFVQWV